MERSKNFNFYLPSRDGDDIADINQISENFRNIDTQLIPDKALDVNSERAISNKAVVEEFNRTVGEIGTALDGIISLQESLIGGVNA